MPKSLLSRVNLVNQDPQAYLALLVRQAHLVCQDLMELPVNPVLLGLLARLVFLVRLALQAVTALMDCLGRKERPAIVWKPECSVMQAQEVSFLKQHNHYLDHLVLQAHLASPVIRVILALFHCTTRRLVYRLYKDP